MTSPAISQPVIPIIPSVGGMGHTHYLQTPQMRVVDNVDTLAFTAAFLPPVKIPSRSELADRYFSNLNRSKEAKSSFMAALGLMDSSNARAIIEQKRRDQIIAAAATQPVLNRKLGRRQKRRGRPARKTKEENTKFAVLHDEGCYTCGLGGLHMLMCATCSRSFHHSCLPQTIPPHVAASQWICSLCSSQPDTIQVPPVKDFNFEVVEQQWLRYAHERQEQITRERMRTAELSAECEVLSHTNGLLVTLVADMKKRHESILQEQQAVKQQYDHANTIVRTLLAAMPIPPTAGLLANLDLDHAVSGTVHMHADAEALEPVAPLSTLVDDTVIPPELAALAVSAMEGHEEVLDGKGAGQDDDTATAAATTTDLDIDKEADGTAMIFE